MNLWLIDEHEKRLRPAHIGNNRLFEWTLPYTREMFFILALMLVGLLHSHSPFENSPGNASDGRKPSQHLPSFKLRKFILALDSPVLKLQFNK